MKDNEVDQVRKSGQLQVCPEPGNQGPTHSLPNILPLADKTQWRHVVPTTSSEHQRSRNTMWDPVSMLLLNKTSTSLTQQRGHVTVTSPKCQMVAKRANLQERCRRRENRSGCYGTRKISAIVAPRVRNAAGASGSLPCGRVLFAISLGRTGWLHLQIHAGIFRQWHKTAIFFHDNSLPRASLEQENSLIYPESTKTFKKLMKILK